MRDAVAVFGPDGPKVGQRVTDPAYVSTTTDIEVARNFAENDDAPWLDGTKAPSPALLEIDVPLNTQMAWVSAARNHGLVGEELVLPRGQTFEVTDVYEELGKEVGTRIPVVEMRLVPPRIQEAEFTERLHPRDRLGKWAHKVGISLRDAEEALGAESLSWGKIREGNKNWRAGGVLVTRSGKRLTADDEVVLFHGTLGENVEAILRRGFEVGQKKQREATRVTTPELARMLGKQVGDTLDYEPGRGAGAGTYLAPTVKSVQPFGENVFAVKVRVGDLIVPPEPERRRSAAAGRIDAIGALLLDDGYTEAGIPASSVRLVRKETLAEAEYEDLHPRGRAGKWIKKAGVSHGPQRHLIRSELDRLLPHAPVPPLQERGTHQGRYVWLKGRYVFVPRGREFRRRIDGVEFHSPEGSTNIYRNGNLIQVEGQLPPPHHQDLTRRHRSVPRRSATFPARRSGRRRGARPRPRRSTR